MIRIALAQINPTVGDILGNQRMISDAIGRAKKSGVDIVAFPELALCGYPPEDLLQKDHFVSDCRAALAALARECVGITAIVGCVDGGSGHSLYNAAAVLADGTRKGMYHKRELPNYGVFDEKRYFAPGSDGSIFVHGGVGFGVTICEDIWVENGLSVLQVNAGAQLLINISSSPYDIDKQRQREQLLKKKAKALGVFVCYVNLVGGQDELVFDGGSMVINPQGRIYSRGKEFEADMVVVDIPVARRMKKPGKKAVVVSSQVSAYPKQAIKKHDEKPLTQLERMYAALVLGTRDYIRKNGFSKVVLGLSGGVDSSLVAAIAVDAIGPENVVGVTMPSKFTSRETKGDAYELAKRLNIRLVEIPIEDMAASYGKALASVFTGCERDSTEENIQARIRGNILMALSNKFGWLVLTTGNKSEIAVGYCTLYGDMSGGFAVIKDISKTNVYALSRLRNAREKSPGIPESVLTRPPTAELRPNQKDQDSLPPYEVLDDILLGYIEQHRSFAQLAKKSGSAETVREVIRMVDRSEYKRRQSPPGIKVTCRAFGKDWRVPITNQYKEW